MTPRVPARSPTVLAVVGFAILQLAWILAVPPFAASDEFDHAYRASAVAHGQWVAPPSDATRGTGALVRASADIVRAAAPECRNLPYTHADDCGTPAGDGPVEMPSGAGRYNPVFYFLIGTAALPLEGTAGLYAMRVAGAVLCLLFLALALMACAGRSPWTRAGVVLAFTPVALFSTTVAAPNGIEMASALAFWVAVSVLLRRDPHPPGVPSTGFLVVAAVLSGATLVTARSLGPLWCAIALAAALAINRRTPREVVRSLRSRTVLLAGGLVGLATVASVGWTLSQRSLRVGLENVDPVTPLETAVLALEANVVWMFGSIAAFPTRDILAPFPVYVCGIGLFIVWMLLVRKVDAVSRKVVLGVLGVTVLIPTVVTIRTYASYGFAWQGRYTLPLAMGLGVLLGVALDRAAPIVRPRVLALAGVVYVVLHVLSVLGAYRHEQGISPGVDNGDWFMLPLPLLGLLTTAGAALVVLGVLRGLDPRESGQA